MGVKEIARKIFGTPKNEIGEPMTAEEVELRSYEKEDNRDMIRALAVQKRAERVKNMFGYENYDPLAKAQKAKMDIPKPKKIKTKGIVYFGK